MSQPCVLGAPTLLHSIQEMTRTGRNIYFREGRRNILPWQPPALDPLLPSLKNPHPAVLLLAQLAPVRWASVGQIEKGGGFLATVTVCLKCRFTFPPCWSQPVSCGASEAAAESVCLWRKWRPHKLNQTLPRPHFLLGGGAGFNRYRRQDDSWLVSFSERSRSCWRILGSGDCRGSNDEVKWSLIIRVKYSQYYLL